MSGSVRFTLRPGHLFIDGVESEHSLLAATKGVYGEAEALYRRVIDTEARRLAPGDPAAFAIRDGRLYIAHSPDLLARWLEDADRRIDAARTLWPAILRR